MRTGARLAELMVTSGVSVRVYAQVMIASHSIGTSMPMPAAWTVYDKVLVVKASYSGDSHVTRR